MNHYPIIGRKPLKSCEAGASDTANPFAHIDYPKCRAFLSAKINLEERAATHFADGTEKHRFHTGVAANFARHLAA